MPPKEQSKASLKAQRAKAKKEKQLLDARIKECQEKCAEAKGFLEPSGRNAQPNFTKSKAALDAAVEAYDASPYPFFLLGQWHRMQGMPTEAIESYSHALDLDPTNVQALEWRAQCYHTLHDFPHAIEDNTSIITLEPENDHAYNMRGLCVLESCVPGLRLRSADFASCVDDFNTAVRLNEANYYAMANLGKACEVQGDSDRAIECYGRALRVNEAYAYARFRRGCTALRVAESIVRNRQQEEDDEFDNAAPDAAEISVGSLQQSMIADATINGLERSIKVSVPQNGFALLADAKAEVRQQLEEEHSAKMSAHLLHVAESDFAALMDPNPEANKAAGDAMVALNSGICALLKRNFKKADECFKLTQEILQNRPALVEDGEAEPIENADMIKQVLAIRKRELKLEKDRMRSAVA
ncbi:tetratricopeptide repeat (TPR) protein [Leptomonas pyrrhocoris]|uniref:Tetratricopeptide repeat (TPR) protein n=1 Tax=Leptomonas pyrrhocoris TaxID=157538 RepID=A0A0M9FVS9_LEPPY|nr:tetratricopeptide repeat (TPR) protein [Leptomonas pyrrhocoris]KPA76967.1 tetratricopeptide repeat (TPR) protein [Leptomonas pyrrhocoris]|eukprot:XP_015655406.1 tetratricopeptide repeat (TPR) protein [Leptomonas pyrrhocoris]